MQLSLRFFDTMYVYTSCKYLLIIGPIPCCLEEFCGKKSFTEFPNSLRFFTLKLCRLARNIPL